jgi:hypothetical protein
MKKLLLATALGVTLSPAANAGIIIDLFSTDQSQVFDGIIENIPACTNGMTDIGCVNNAEWVGGTQATLGNDIIGGERDLVVINSYEQGGDNPNRGAAMDVYNGVLNFSTDTQTAGTGWVVWDGTDGDAYSVDYTGLGGIDLSGYSGFSVTTIFSDADYQFTINMYTDGNNYTAIDLLAQATNTPVTTFIPFLPFTLSEAQCDADPATVDCRKVGSGLDLTSVGAIAVGLNTGDPTDVHSLAIDLTIDQVVTVPEPSTLAILSLGLLGMGAYSRKRKLA